MTEEKRKELYQECEIELDWNDGVLTFYHNKKKLKPEEDPELLCKDPREYRCECKRCYCIEMTFDEWCDLIDKYEEREMTPEEEKEYLNYVNFLKEKKRLKG